MILKVLSFHYATNLRRIFLYYLFYCFLFLFSHIAMVSIFSFFHFLLDHEMNTIENWLNRNTWELLTFSKMTSFFIASRVVKLNRYDGRQIRDYFLNKSLLPSKQIFGMIIFLLTIFYAFITQFGGGVNHNQFKEQLFYSSFFGSTVYYLSDFLFIYLLMRVFEIKRTDYSKILYPCLLLFLISSKIALPYLNKFYVFLMIHFISLFVISLREKVADLLLYAVLIIAPLSTIYGLDIVWDNAYSLFSYEKSLPIIGSLGIWGLALGYYTYSRDD